jgi:TRAP-type mannitol/chloroaromatic compound transport system substrate-binding protein
MRRRDILTKAVLAAGTAATFPAPAIAQGIRQLTMLTDHPEGPGMLPSARRLAQTIMRASEGRIRLEVSASGAVVRPFQTFDAVQSGIADLFHSHIGYFERMSPAFHFFSGVPYGFTADELFAWVRFGGGQELWDKLSAEFNIKPFLASSTGAQMGGWYTHEMKTVESFNGLRYRMAGLGAKVFGRMGATVVLLPGAETLQSLRSGAIDACEWIGPWLDTAMGLNKVSKFYYYPGWQEPGTSIALGVNMRVWESFSDADRRLIEAAATSEYSVSLAEFNTNNALALRKLREEGEVKIGKFDDAILRTFGAISKDVVAEAGSSSEMSTKIYASYEQFRTVIADWTDIADAGYLGARRLSSS